MLVRPSVLVGQRLVTEWRRTGDPDCENRTNQFARVTLARAAVPRPAAWFRATATMPAPSVSVSAIWVLSRKNTRAATARTAKQTVKTVFSVTCEGACTGSGVGIAATVRWSSSPHARDSGLGRPSLGLPDPVSADRARAGAP